MILSPAIRVAVDARLRAAAKNGGGFTYAEIETALAEHYRIGEDVPNIEDDELHSAVSEMHKDYVDLGLAKEGC